jgi:hypothetical protein
MNGIVIQEPFQRRHLAHGLLPILTVNSPGPVEVELGCVILATQVIVDKYAQTLMVITQKRIST